MRHLNIEFKTAEAIEGVVTGLAAVYGNVDRVDDVIVPGAFTKTLRENGGRVPLLYQHRQDQPIGACTLQDTSAGLALTGKLVLEVPEALKAWQLMKAGVLKSFSIGYDVVRSSPRGGVRVLEELKLWEVSVVTIPANPLAAVTSVKAAEEREAERLAGEVIAMSLIAKLQLATRQLTK